MVTVSKFSIRLLAVVAVVGGFVIGLSLGYPLGLEDGKNAERREIARMGLGRYVFSEESGRAIFEYGERSRYGYYIRYK